MLRRLGFSLIVNKTVGRFKTVRAALLRFYRLFHDKIGLLLPQDLSFKCSIWLGDVMKEDGDVEEVV